MKSGGPLALSRFSTSASALCPRGVRPGEIDVEQHGERLRGHHPVDEPGQLVARGDQRIAPVAPGLVVDVDEDVGRRVLDRAGEALMDADGIVHQPIAEIAQQRACR